MISTLDVELVNFGLVAFIYLSFKVARLVSRSATIKGRGYGKISRVG